MDYDFLKICRVCLKEGVMMSIFKVNVFKKMMSCASVQVWQNDGLPAQICNKCSAKLHISFQFKKQCEKSDAKLRQYVSNMPAQQQQQSDIIHQPSDQQMVQQQQIVQPQQNTNCVFVECSPMLDIQQPDTFIPVSQSQINYNMPSTQTAHLQLAGYNIQGEVQVYNGTYAMPLLHNNAVLASTQNGGMQMQIPLAPQQQQLSSLQPIMQQVPHIVLADDKDDKLKRTGGNKVRRDNNNGTIKLMSSDVNNKQCATCNKVFATVTKLSRHMKSHSTDMPYKCKVCSKAFSHSGNYKIHMRMHTDERPFRCTVCDKGCRQAQDLEKHMRTHTGERPHKCTLCTRAFSTSSNLIAHIRTHTGERPYVCCVCQKAFCQSNELTKHMRTHTGEKSHVCDICHKGFNGSSTLIVHRRSHTGERPYVCKVCNKGFTQSSCLAVHLKRHNGEKNFRCNICDGMFVTNGDLKDHLLSHGGGGGDEKSFNCHLCDKRYARTSDLNKHLGTHNIEFKTTLLDES